jgi:hypothetical protein
MYTRGENQMFNKKLIVLFVFAALFALVPFVGAQEPTAEPTAEATEESVLVEAEAGDSVEVDTSETGTTVIEVVGEDAPQPWDIPHLEVWLGLVVVFMLAFWKIYDDVIVPRLGGKQLPFQPIIQAGERVGMDFLYSEVQRTPSTWDDDLFDYVARKRGYVKPEDRNQAQG